VQAMAQKQTARSLIQDRDNLVARTEDEIRYVAALINEHGIIWVDSDNRPHLILSGLEEADAKRAGRILRLSYFPQTNLYRISARGNTAWIWLKETLPYLDGKAKAAAEEALERTELLDTRITPQQVLRLKADYLDGADIWKLSWDYNLSQNTVTRIVAGETRKNVELGHGLDEQVIATYKKARRNRVNTSERRRMMEDLIAALKHVQENPEDMRQTIERLAAAYNNKASTMQNYLYRVRSNLAEYREIAERMKADFAAGNEKAIELLCNMYFDGDEQLAEQTVNELSVNELAERLWLEHGTIR